MREGQEAPGEEVAPGEEATPKPKKGKKVAAEKKPTKKGEGPGLPREEAKRLKSLNCCKKDCPTRKL